MSSELLDQAISEFPLPFAGIPKHDICVAVAIEVERSDCERDESPAWPDCHDSLVSSVIVAGNRRVEIIPAVLAAAVPLVYMHRKRFLPYDLVTVDRHGVVDVGVRVDVHHDGVTAEELGFHE